MTVDGFMMGKQGEKIDIIQIEKNMNELIFVVSLPRTGTKSMCKMLSMIGYKSKHCPSMVYNRMITEGYNAFSDTPCYTYSFIKERMFDNSKFIYIEKNVDKWVESIEKVKLHEGYEFLMNLTMKEHINQARMVDMKSMGEIFGYHKAYDKEHFKECFINHKEQVKEMLGDKLLLYNFDDGWQPLCKFLNKYPLDEDIPHLNKNIINDKIEG